MGHRPRNMVDAMSRRLVHVNSTGSVIFDGFEGETFVVMLESSVRASRVRIKNISPGQLYTVIFRQNHVGGHTFEWPTGLVHNAGTIDTAAQATSVKNFIGDTGGQLVANIPGTWQPKN